MRCAIALALAAVLVGASGRAADAPNQDCKIGVYRLADGRLLDLGSAGHGNDLRWRLEDGRTGRLVATDHWSSALGWTTRPDGVVVDLQSCAAGGLTFTDVGGQPLLGKRLTFETRDVNFASGGAKLHGRLVMPAGQASVPVVVEVQGSGKGVNTSLAWEQRMLPAKGIGVFVYDKRGTGQSGGVYSQDFGPLAADAAAAAAEARALAGARLQRLGFQGESQGGYVAPLAALTARVDFMIIDYGLAVSPADQNTDNTVAELARKGFSGDDLKEAAEVAEATNAVIGSHFRAGYEQLDAVRARYSSKPWFPLLGGQWTGEMLQYSDALLRIGGPSREDGTPIDYDPMPVLQRLDVPMLWVLADQDTTAPNAETRRRLAQLAAEGKPITVLAFPDTEHGILEFISASGGRRGPTRMAEGYLQTTLDWALRGEINMPYGRAALIVAPRPAS